MRNKFLLSFGLIVVSIIYAVWQSMNGFSLLATTSSPPASPVAGLPTGSALPSQPMMGKPMMRSGLYADGSYTGSPADAYYGMVQVKAIIRNGQIADVQFLQYPNDRDTSRAISAQAMPLLTQEAIQAQSAQVNGVSGATETSGAFVQSLASALALAKK